MFCYCLRCKDKHKRAHRKRISPKLVGGNPYICFDVLKSYTALLGVDEERMALWNVFII